MEDLRIALLNVRSIERESTRFWLCNHLHGCGVDIAAVTETHLSGNHIAPYLQGFTLYSSGPKESPSHSGVGFAVRGAAKVKNWVPIDGRLCYAHFVCDGLGFVVICCNAPTLRAPRVEAEEFYRRFAETLTTVRQRFSRLPLLIAGDFNTSIGDAVFSTGVAKVRPCWIPLGSKTCRNGMKLVEFCRTHGVQIANFENPTGLRAEYTWNHPRTSVGAVKDMWLIPREWRGVLRRVEVEPQISFTSDHHMVYWRFRPIAAALAASNPARGLNPARSELEPEDLAELNPARGLNPARSVGLNDNVKSCSKAPLNQKRLKP